MALDECYYITAGEILTSKATARGGAYFRHIMHNRKIGPLPSVDNVYCWKRGGGGGGGLFIKRIWYKRKILFLL